MTDVHILVQDLQERNPALFKAADDLGRLSAMASEAWDVSPGVAEAFSSRAWSYPCDVQAEFPEATEFVTDAKIDWRQFGESTVAWEQLTRLAMAEPGQVWFGGKPESVNAWIGSKRKLAHLRDEIIYARGDIHPHGDLHVHDVVLAPEDLLARLAVCDMLGDCRELVAPSNAGSDREPLTVRPEQLFVKSLHQALTYALQIVKLVMRIAFAVPHLPELDQHGTFLKERPFFETHGMGRPPSHGWAC